MSTITGYTVQKHKDKLQKLFKMIKYLPVFLLLATLTSCVQKKHLFKNNRIAMVKRGYNQDSLLIYTIDEPVKAKLEDKGTYLVVKPADVTKLKKDEGLSRIIVLENSDGFRVTTLDTYYAVENKYDTVATSLRYFDSKFGLQTLTIPLKFRKALPQDPVMFPKQVETGVNLGFAPGWKFTYNVYKPNKNLFDKYLSQYSFTTGVLFGLGATDLKGATNAPGLIGDRKAPLFSYGFYGMLGVHNINFGLAWGKDKVMGEGKENWVYQNEPWWGVFVALDLIKF